MAARAGLLLLPLLLALSRSTRGVDRERREGEEGSGGVDCALCWVLFYLHVGGSSLYMYMYVYVYMAICSAPLTEKVGVDIGC